MAATKKGYTQILVGFERTSPRPLELNTVFDTYNEALDYAMNNPTSYVGQVISVSETSEIYVVIKDGTSENKSLDKITTSGSTSEFRSTRYVYSNVDNLVLEHNLGYNPEVIFLDQRGQRLYPLIEYPNKDTIKISWNGIRSGSFYLI